MGTYNRASDNRCFMTLDQVTLESFAPHRGSTFTIDAGGGRVFVVRLEEVNAGRPAPRGPGRPQPFSLIFVEPAGTYLPQAIYRVVQETLGDLDVFLVPIGPGPDGGMRFEAVFN